MASRGTRRRAAGRAAGVLLVAAAIPTAAFQIANLFADQQIAIIIIGLALFTIVVGLQVRTVVRNANSDAAELDAVDEIRITMKRALGPIATLLAEMPGLRPAARRAHLDRVSDRAAASLADYLLREVPDVRANVYWIDNAATQLFPVSQAGAGERPGTFMMGGAAADENLAWVLVGGKPRKVDDYRLDSDPDGEAPYRSYVAVVIRSDSHAYGMVTADSPAIAAFTSTDVETVSVVAGLLATACAIAYPGRSRPSPRA